MASNELKPLKREKKSNARKPHHEHHWAYEHMIYGLGDMASEGIAVHRQCSECGVHELCKVYMPKWTRNVKGFDLPNLNK